MGGVGGSPEPIQNSNGCSDWPSLHPAVLVGSPLYVQPGPVKAARHRLGKRAGAIAIRPLGA